MKFDRKKLKKHLELYLVSDRFWLAGRELQSDIEKAIEGGVSFVQIREKELPLEEFIEEAKKIKELCERHEIPFVVNDSVEVAKAVDADGIHVGQSDMPAIEVRKILGEDKIVGVSAQSVEDALRAQEEGADYLGVGAMFSTKTKKDADDVSFATLKAIVEAVHIPVIAIGGIDEHNLLELKGSGIDGVAIVSAIMAKENIFEASKILKKKTQELVKC
ncbi:thiamine phosphate synthase [Amedibacillus sp. YH-ame10]